MHLLIIVITYSRNHAHMLLTMELEKGSLSLYYRYIQGIVDQVSQKKKRREKEGKKEKSMNLEC